MLASVRQNSHEVPRSIDLRSPNLKTMIRRIPCTKLVRFKELSCRRLPRNLQQSVAAAGGIPVPHRPLRPRCGNKGTAARPWDHGPHLFAETCGRATSSSPVTSGVSACGVGNSVLPLRGPLERSTCSSSSEIVKVTLGSGRPMGMDAQLSHFPRVLHFSSFADLGSPVRQAARQPGSIG